MQTALSKKSILQKTAQVGVSSFLSKCLGIVREILQMRYIGANQLSDAFNVAYRIPNFMRKVFAEGALSASFVPTLVKVVKGGDQKEANRLMTLVLCLIGGFFLILCTVVALFPTPFVLFFAPGFLHKPVEFETAVKLTRVLIFLVFFMSASTLLAGAMQSKNHFQIPALGPLILNVFYIIGLLIALAYGMALSSFIWFLILGAIVQFIIYVVTYIKVDFSFAWPDAQTWKHFRFTMTKFLPCVLSMSAVEISLLIDGQFGSSLPAGSLTLISLSSRLMGIALSTFAGAFSTVLYSHFSRITTYAPRRLSFYILESAKLMFWGTIPATIFLGFFSRDILYTIFYRFSAKNLTLDQISLAGTLLVVFSLGLFFYSVNKIFLSMYYAMHNTSLPMFITLTGVAGNILLNRLLMPSYGAVGLALATTSASLIQTALFVYCAPRALGVTLYGRRFFSYVGYYLAQLTVVLAVAYLIYRLGMRLFLAIPYGDFFISHIGLWLWVGPLCVGVFVVLYLLRNKGGMKLYFLE